MTGAETKQLLALVNSLAQTAPAVGTKVANSKAGLNGPLGNQSLAKFTESARISPYVLIEENIRQQAYVTDILHAATNIYAGYYLTAVSLLGDVTGISVLDKLDRINPNRPINLPGRLMKMSQEDFALGLPFQDRMKPTGKLAWTFNAESHTFSKEAWDPFGGVGGSAKGTDPNDPIYAAGGGKRPPSTASGPADNAPCSGSEGPAGNPGMGRDTIVTAKEASNLAVGKLLEVAMVINGQTLRIPTTVTLFPNVSDTESFAHILGLHERSHRLKERWHDWRSGKISFWNDFVMMRDIIKKHRQVLVKDKSGYYAAVTRQDRNHKIAASLSAPSLAEASNILIFSTTCARRAEALIGGTLSDCKTREAVFEKTKAMIMFVIDRDRELVRIYHSGIEMANELSLRELKMANKNSGPDVAEILKAYQLGNAPSF